MDGNSEAELAPIERELPGSVFKEGADGRKRVPDGSDAELDVNLPDGAVAEKVFVERLEPAAQHSQEVLDEDDAFLGAVTAEAWD